MPKMRCLLDRISFDELCRLPRDNGDSGDFWFTCDGHTVTFTEQKLGELPTQQITIPIRQARRLIKMLTAKYDVSRAAEKKRTGDRHARAAR